MNAKLSSLDKHSFEWNLHVNVKKNSRRLNGYVVMLLLTVGFISVVCTSTGPKTHIKTWFVGNEMRTVGVWWQMNLMSSLTGRSVNELIHKLQTIKIGNFLGTFISPQIGVPDGAPAVGKKNCFMTYHGLLYL